MRKSESKIEQAKAEREKKVFHEFVKAAQLDYDLDTAKNGKESEPDIVCKHNADGYAAFELVEICDPHIAKALTNMQSDGEMYLRGGDPTIAIMYESNDFG